MFNHRCLEQLCKYLFGRSFFSCWISRKQLDVWAYCIRLGQLGEGTAYPRNGPQMLIVGANNWKISNENLKKPNWLKENVFNNKQFRLVGESLDFLMKRQTKSWYNILNFFHDNVTSKWKNFQPRKKSTGKNRRSN